MGSARPVRRSRRPSGPHLRDHPDGRSRREALLALSRPSRDVSSKPRKAPALAGQPKPTRALSRNAASPGLSFPTTHAGQLDPHSRVAVARRHRVPRPGFGYPPRGFHQLASRRRSAGASLGFALHGVPLARGRFPSRGPCPPDVARRSASQGSVRRAAFRASFPRRVRAVVEKPKLLDRRCHPGLRPSRAFPPSARGLACSREPGPLALRRGDVPIRLDHRASRIGWVGLARFRAAGSPGVSHLSTVTALRSSRWEAGSWVRLTRDLA